MAPLWGIQSLLGVFLTHRMAGDDVVVVVEDASVPPIVREQWASLGQGEGLVRVTEFGAPGTGRLHSLLVLHSPRSSVADLARRERVLAWAREHAAEVLEGTLSSTAFAPGWDMADLPWRKTLFGQSSFQTSAAAESA
ncbi:MAG: hypothetical protein O2819_04940 [Planctomycetota bacterium]|nr:hypothetical protein [Planctomycetota bacterium]MDA1105993.1 hypothetical protein [Planctomycetota bacterium]